MAGINTSAADAGPGMNEAPGSGSPDMGGTGQPASGAPMAAPTAPAQAPPPANAPAPAQPASPTVAQPGTPHAGLLNMLGGLFLGMDAFAKAAATGGREGGVTEVLAAQQNAARLKMQQDAAAREAKESDVRIKHLQAQTNASVAQTQILLRDAPLNYQRLVLENQRSMADFLINDLKIAPAFAVPMIQGQTTDQHLDAINGKANGDLVNNTVVPSHNDTLGGSGTSYGFNFDQLRKVNISQEQATPTLANLQNQIDLAKGILGEKDPAVQVAQGRLDLMKQAPNVNAWDFYNFNQQVQAQLMSKVSNKQALTEAQTKQASLAQKQQEVAAGARPRNLDDAQGRATQAQLDYQKNPTPETKQALNDATAQLQGFKRLEISKTYADAAARVQAQRQADEQDLKLVAGELVKPDNLTALKDVASMRGDQRLRLYAEAKKLDPNFDPGVTNNKIRFLQQFTNPNGKTMQNIASYNTFLQHGGDLLDVTSNYRTTNTQLLNTPLNKIRNAFGDATYTQFEGALEPVRTEYTNFLKAGFAPQGPDIKAGETILSDNATPAQVEAAVKQMSHTALRRADSVNEEYRTVMGSNYPDLVTPAAKDAAAKIGLGKEVSKYGTGGRVGARSAAAPQPAPQPAGATMKVPGSDGRLHWSDGKQDLGVVQ